MAKNNKQPAPERCPVCGRQPVVAKVKAGRYVVDCPNPTCLSVNYAVGGTEAEAVEAWNKEVAKK